jgi:hypothetical protein
MMIADYLLAWSVVTVALAFAARLLTGAREERVARGLYLAAHGGAHRR